jgi:hypothetical protein
MEEELQEQLDRQQQEIRALRDRLQAGERQARRIRRFGAVAIGAAIAVVFATMALANNPISNNVINACYNASTGSLHLQVSRSTAFAGAATPPSPGGAPPARAPRHHTADAHRAAR